MNSKSLISKSKKIIASLREKGFFGTYNFLRDFCLSKIYPYYAVTIEITTKCNLNCIMCAHGSPNFRLRKDSNKNMPFEKFKFIINNLCGLKSINFAGLGENFLNEDFMKMIRYAKSKNILIDFFSNFYFINEKIAEELIEIGVNKIHISIDGATKETYEKIRVGSDFEKVINNVKTIFRLKKEKNKYSPDIYFHYTINRYNIDEVVKYIEMIHSLREGQKTVIVFSKIESLFFKAALSNKTFESITLSEKTIQEVDRKSKELGILVVWSNNIFKNKPLINRCACYLEPFISVNGDFFPCCTFLGSKSFQKDMIFGNIFESNLKKIWQSKKYINFRKLLRKGKTPPFCGYCCFFEVSKD